MHFDILCLFTIDHHSRPRVHGDERLARLAQRERVWLFPALIQHLEMTPSKKRKTDSTIAPSTSSSSTESTKSTKTKLLHIQEPIAYGKYCDIRKAELSGKKVAVKISSVHQNAIRAISYEAAMYDALKLLQGRYIPLIIDRCTDPLGMEMPIMPRLVKITNWTDLAKECAQFSLGQLHKKGFLHGIVRQDNFMQDEDGRVFAIDLENTKPSTNAAAFSAEMNIVALFGPSSPQRSAYSPSCTKVTEWLTIQSA